MSTWETSLAHKIPSAASLCAIYIIHQNLIFWFVYFYNSTSNIKVLNTEILKFLSLFCPNFYFIFSNFYFVFIIFFYVFKDFLNIKKAN